MRTRKIIDWSEKHPRKDCINWNANNPSLRNHCTALANQFCCTEDCSFYAPMDEQKVIDRELEISAYAAMMGGDSREA